MSISINNLILNTYSSGIRFVSILGQREGIPSKPHPQIIEDTLAASGMTADDVLYTGDSCVDMETGRNAGVMTVGVSWGFRPRAELEAYAPHAIIDRPEQLYSILEGDIKNHSK